MLPILLRSTLYLVIAHEPIFIGAFQERLTVPPVGVPTRLEEYTSGASGGVIVGVGVIVAVGVGVIVGVGVGVRVGVGVIVAVGVGVIVGVGVGVGVRVDVGVIVGVGVGVGHTIVHTVKFDAGLLPAQFTACTEYSYWKLHC